jgi:hypothetical protein
MKMMDKLNKALVTFISNGKYHFVKMIIFSSWVGAVVVY